MSAFYDLASLVLVPSGYKASKVYAQKPLTTDGQLTFSRASTATRVNSAGLIETVSSNVPRLDYLGSTCPKLLLEPSRTNLVISSDELQNAGNWSYSNQMTVANGTQTNPAGASQTLVFTADAASGTKRAGITSYAGSGFAFNDIICASAFVKAKGYNFVTFGGVFNNESATYNLSTGTVHFTGAAVLDAKIENYGNGWYRIINRYTFGNTIGNGLLYFQLTPSPAGDTNYTGDGTSGCLAYGGQVEKNVAYHTSYIPTTSAAVTRLADAASKTGISSLIGSTEGTVFIDAEIDFNKSNFTILGSTYVNGGSVFTHSVYFYINNNKIDGQIWWTPQFTGWTGLSPVLTNGRHKLAIAWKANDFAYYINGTLIASSTAYSNVPTGMNRLDVGDYYGSYGTTNSYNQALLFKTRLTNAQLAELTTL